MDRVDSAIELAERKYGIGLGEIYWTVGVHDVVGVLDAPDVETLSAFLLASAGNVRSTTLRAFDREEMGASIGRLG